MAGSAAFEVDVRDVFGSSFMTAATQVAALMRLRMPRAADNTSEMSRRWLLARSSVIVAKAWSPTGGGNSLHPRSRRLRHSGRPGDDLAIRVAGVHAVGLAHPDWGAVMEA